MSLPWEPPPSPPTQFLYAKEGSSSDSGYNISEPPSTAPQLPENKKACTLGDFDVLFSFLRLERTSLSIPSSTSSNVALRNQDNPTSPNEPSDSLSNITATSRLGDLSMAMRYLQAHRIQSPEESLFAEHASENTPFLTQPTSPTLSAQSILCQETDAETMNNKNEGSLGVNRRRIKKKATRKLPIDEPSSSSCGGCVSSESDHKEVMGPEPELAHNDSNPSINDSNKNDSEDDIDDNNGDASKDISSSSEQMQLHRQHMPQSQVEQSTANISENQPSDYFSSTSNLDKQPPIVSDMNNTPIAAAAASNATAVVKRRRPWRMVKVLKEMKALFIAELQEICLLSNNGQLCKTSSSADTSTPFNPLSSLKTHDADVERELVLEQTPGHELEYSWCPRTHYNDFWRSCASRTTTTLTSSVIPSTTIAATVTSDDLINQLRSLSSTGEEWPSRLNSDTTTSPPSTASRSKTSTTLTCLSETAGKNGDGKHLLAMRMRDTFLVPKGILVLEKALSRADTPTSNLNESSAFPAHEETPRSTILMTQMKLRSMNELSRITAANTPGSSRLLDTSKVDSMATATEQLANSKIPLPTLLNLSKKMLDDSPVFIFVDNSNILHGFHQLQAELQKADGNPIGGTIQTKTEGDQEQERVPLSDSLEDGVAVVTPMTSNDDSPPRPNSAISTGTKVKVMAKGGQRYPKFNYSKFFEILKRDRPTSRQVLVGSWPLYQELDEAVEHKYETHILRRVKKFVQGELGVIPIPVKQLRYPSNYSNSIEQKSVISGMASSNLYENSDHSTDKSFMFNSATTSTTSVIPPVVSSGMRGEQGVDELLHLKMLETLLDNKPATMVLATGDGGDSEFGGGGFYAVIKRALDRGWNVEIVSWEDQLSGVYLELALEYGYNCQHKATMGGKPCHLVHNQQKQRSLKHQLKARVTGSKKQRIQAQSNENEEEKAKEEEGRDHFHMNKLEPGHLRVWCLDWHGDVLSQPVSQ